MPLILPALLLLSSAALSTQTPQPAASDESAASHEGRRGGFGRRRGSVFLSPMGEPFRSDDPAVDNVGTWFTQADTNHDGAITLAEMQADAARFFATLDTNHDGEIDPDELTRYETEVAPEVQVGTQMGAGSTFRRGEGFGGGRRGGGWGGRRGGGGEGGGGRRGGIGSFEEGLEGAGRYSFLNIPEPVISADANLNRGVSREEFLAAAANRFLLLDTNHDGRLTRDELPPLPQVRSGREKKRKGPPLRPQGEPLPL